MVYNGPTLEHTMTNFLKLDEIDAGSIWTGADGSGSLVQVVGFDFDADDIIVSPLVNGEPVLVMHKMDTFKFQYRYRLLEE